MAKRIAIRKNETEQIRKSPAKISDPFYKNCPYTKIKPIESERTNDMCGSGCNAVYGKDTSQSPRINRDCPEEKINIQGKLPYRGDLKGESQSAL